MIAIAESNQSFRTILEYVFRENRKVKVVYGNFPQAVEALDERSCNVNLIIKQFEQTAKAKPNIKQPCYHLKFSSAIEDDLSDEDWSELSDELLKELDLESNQTISVLYRDTRYPNSDKIPEHLHMVINKIDYRLYSSSEKLYYDYSKIEQFLRKFESKHNLTKIDYDYEKHVVREIGEEKQDRIPIGDWLRDLEDLQKVGEDLKTREAEINGIDIVSYGIVSASSIAKIAVVLIPKAKTEEDLQNLEGILNTTSKIPLSAIGDAKNLPIEELKEKLTAKDIPQFTVQAQKILDQQLLDIRKLPSKKKDESLKDSNPIFDRLQAYIKTVESMVENLPPEYGISNSSGLQVNLEDIQELKSISVSVNDREVYRAKTEGGKWREEVNTLDERSRKTIERLPQNEEEVVKELFGRKAAVLFANHMNQINKEQFKWTARIENGKPIDYWVSISNKTKQGITISASNSANKKIFESEISNSGLVSVVNNKIPTTDLEALIKHHKFRNINLRKNEHYKDRKSHGI